MNAEAMAALRTALESDESLRTQFEAATSDAEIVELAKQAGIALDDSAVAPAGELTDAELAGVSGGYTFPATDWIYCDNPWTNYWCTLRC